MESSDTLFSEEWLLSNVLSADFYDTDQIHNDYDYGQWKGQELSYATPIDHPAYNVLNDDVDGFNISWLDNEVTSICNLDDVTPRELVAPSLVAPVDLVNPEDLAADDHAPPGGCALEITDFNTLHLPEPVDEPGAALMILDALSNPTSMGLTYDLLSPDEVESILSSPPGSPNLGDNMSNLGDRSPAPSSPDMEIKPHSSQDFISDFSSDSTDDSPPIKRGRKRSARVVDGDAPPVKASKSQTRKERKKDQNKCAATKYRLKKRAEDMATKNEYEQLESRNISLKREVESMTSEIKYMKSLLNEVLRSKGVVIT